MGIVVRLVDIVDAMDAGNGEWQTYLDTTNGEIVLVTDEDRRLLLNDEDVDLHGYPEWQRNSIEQARLVGEHPDRFLPLPDSFEVHEWDMMRRFALSVETAALRDELLNAVHGSGAFRMFRAITARIGLREAWFSFRQKQYEQVAREWLEANGIAFVEGPRSGSATDGQASR